MAEPDKPQRSKAETEVAMTRIAPLGPMQRMAAQHLADSHRETAPVTLFGDVDASSLLALRRNLNQDRPEGSANRVSITHLLIKVVAQALRAHPALNVGFIDGQLHEWQDFNIGVALAMPKGELIVPVIRHADGKSLDAIIADLSALETRARAGKLALADVKGGTFTLSNAGMVKSARWTTPIIHRPQCAILGAGAIREAAVIKDGRVEPGIVLPLSLTFDHRLVNGLPASLFLDSVYDLIADASRIALDPLPAR